MKCKNCGNILSEDSISCFLCGSTDLVKNEEEKIPSLILNNEESISKNNVVKSSSIDKKSNLFINISLVLVFICILGIVIVEKFNNTLDYSFISLVFLLLGIFIFSILFIVSLWKIFVKTGRSGFISLIPIYNLYCFTKISIGNAWLFIILFIPVVNVIFWMYLCYKLSILFGKNNLYSLLSALLWIYFIPRIAFDDSIYLGIRKK